MAVSDIAAFYNAINYKLPKPDHEGTPYFPSAQEDQSGSSHIVNRDRDAKGLTKSIIYTVYKWGDILVSSYKTLLVMGFCLAEMDERDHMTYEVLAFIPQAARDCVIRAKDVMGKVSEELQFPKTKLRLSGKIIAMGMSHYCGHGSPCNGFHELFFNGLMFVLQGVVGTNLAELEQNVSLFVGGEFGLLAKGGRYTLDTLCLEHKAGDEMCCLKFARGNESTTKVRANAMVDSEEESNESAMDE